MEALHAAVKAELGEDGLSAGGRHAKLPTAEHRDGWSVSVMKAVEVKTENYVDLYRETLVNVEIKTETGTAVHGLAEVIVDAGGERRVQPTRGVNRRAVACADDIVGSAGGSASDEEWTSAPRRRWKAARDVTDAAQGAVVRLAPEETADRLASNLATTSDEALPAVVGAARRRSDAAWGAQLAKLKAYKGRHGDCIVPRGWAEDPQLGRWIHTQRQCKKKLDRGDSSERMTAVRVAKLDALGFVWELPRSGGGPLDGAGWEAQLAKLKAYKHRHGDCNVPQGWEDPRLGKWVVNQRQNKKALERGEPCKGMTAARATKLQALGFAWELSAAAISKQCSNAKRNDAAWEAQLAKLKAYKRKHGDCNVPARWAEDPPLGRWVSNQRRHKKALDRGEPSLGITAARTAMLDVLGFAWELSAAEISKRNSAGSGTRDDVGWEVQLAKLKVYKCKHGDCNVPARWAEDPPLGRWVDNQRTRKKALDRGQPNPGMTAARTAKLEALGFASELSAAARSKLNSEASQDDAGWEVQVVKLKAYKRRHGDCKLPQGWAEDKPLGRWVDNQRQNKKKLDRGEPSEGMSLARVEKLDALGFAWVMAAAKKQNEGNRDDAG
jgi:hypothetical protein